MPGTVLCSSVAAIPVVIWKKADLFFSLLVGNVSRKHNYRFELQIHFTDRPLTRQFKYSDISSSQPLYFMVSRFHLICSMHKLAGCNLKFNMGKAYNKGSHLACDEYCIIHLMVPAMWSNHAWSSGLWTKGLSVYFSFYICILTAPIRFLLILF